MPLSEIQNKLKDVFDSVSETQDETFMARLNKTDYPTRNAAVSDITKRLLDAYPDAKIQSHGSVSSKGRILQWYIEFVV